MYITYIYIYVAIIHTDRYIHIYIYIYIIYMYLYVYTYIHMCSQKKSIWTMCLPVYYQSPIGVRYLMHFLTKLIKLNLLALQM